MKDLLSYEKEIYFHEWSNDVATIILRHDKEYSKLFKSGPNLSEFIELKKKGDAISQISEITVS